MSGERRHDLDALRGFAMLLGIGLHASLSFFPSPWPVRDPQQNGLLGLLFLAIHGFRMPLFFLISGYFTTLVCERRGIGGLLKQRAARILLPCLLGLMTIVPATRWASAVARRTASPRAAATSLAQAVRIDDKAAIKRFLSTPNERDRVDDELGITPLSWAVLRGDLTVARGLLDAGADPNGANRDGNRPLHAAAFAGRNELATLLLERGADAAKRNDRGDPPLASSNVPWETTRFIFEAIGLPTPEPGKLELQRAAVRRQLPAAVNVSPRPATGTTTGETTTGEKTTAEKAIDATTTGERTDLAGRYWAWLHSPNRRVTVGRWSFHPFDADVFLHLWFLWFLWLYAAAFAFVGSIAGEWLKRVPLGGAAWGLIAITPLPMWFMGGGEAVYFGPDTSIGWLPFPHLFVFYGLFFSFGALMYAREKGSIATATRRVLEFEGGPPASPKQPRSRFQRSLWVAQIGLALLVVFPICVVAAGKREVAIAAHFAYVWLMSLGMIGACRAMLSREWPMVRYFSDASYWLYLAHLPLVIGLQGMARGWPFGPMTKFFAINIIAVPLLLLSYHFLVRRTWIGMLLNGRNRFVANAAPRVQSVT
ncbi:MAG: acyltransferase family protein [Planctomycetota bacterium]